MRWKPSSVSTREGELDEYEQHIEDTIEKFVPADIETQATGRRIAQQVRKSKNVNIRIREWDLELIRPRGSYDGIPYQTLIARVLHKYVTDQFVDARHIRKALQLIGNADVGS